MIEVLRSGPLTTVQDLGRPGFAHLGVPRSGGLDVPALRAANRLVGNAAGHAVLEITLGGFAARFAAAGTVAVTGAPAPVKVDGVAVEPGGPVEVPAGSRLDVGHPGTGLRCYLAVAGGIAAQPVLGSRSTDTLSGLGPAVLRTGARLAVGADPAADPWPADDSARMDGASDPAGVDGTSDLAGVDGAAGTSTPACGFLRIRFGPRDDWFTRSALDTLVASAYTIGMHSNRVGARLSGPALTRSVPGELPSEGIVLGAVQVPADGQPLVFLADHPTTGGYPVIGVVDPADLPLLAQARPGATVRFHGPQQ